MRRWRQPEVSLTSDEGVSRERSNWLFSGHFFRADSLVAKGSNVGESDPILVRILHRVEVMSSELESCAVSRREADLRASFFCAQFSSAADFPSCLSRV